jgi:hypothetical protein
MIPLQIEEMKQMWKMSEKQRYWIEFESTRHQFFKVVVVNNLKDDLISTNKNKHEEDILLLVDNFKWLNWQMVWLFIVLLFAYNS